MKNLLAFLCILLVLSCQEKTYDSYTIEANAPGIHNGIRAYLKATNEKGLMVAKDTAIVMKERFTFSGIRNEPSLEFLFINGINGGLPLIVEHGEISIEVNKDTLQASKIQGTKNNETFTKFLDERKELGNEISDIVRKQREAYSNNDTLTLQALDTDIKNMNKAIFNHTINFIQEDQDSYLAAILLIDIIKTRPDSLKSIEANYEKLDATIKASSYGKKINNYIVTQKKLKTQQAATQIGKIAPNFEAFTPEGNRLSLNDIKGKVTIIDFWASWCGPCRRENPNVVKMYNKYHDKGLEIIGVSLDRNGHRDRWIDAIEKDKLTWHHISNLEHWNDPIAKMYNVTGIPATFILNTEGKIIAKNLRGEALENKVAELLN
ncbi:TlpA disulfide reductase family protein [Changchengzhania lutea]|uniref:TlpA disulfide reductase family protein n=1 Tax=Changchengzhania lutea TaxID=2049305 RepID=UPI00115F088D|nr:TlpA disulfide reductase family protein [Changchengzhania lutea]